MGSLSELKENRMNLLMTTSNLAEIYIYDELKNICKANRESIIEVTSKETFREMLELVNIQSYLAEKWLFILNYTKSKNLIKQNRSIFQSDTSIFLVKVENYRDFKEFKELYPNCNDMYLMLLRQKDILTLLGGYNLSQKILNFVVKSYSKEPEKIFQLRNELINGTVINTQSEVVKLLGVSTGSVNHFAIKLLDTPPTTERGMKMVYSNRIKYAKDLCETYGVSTFKNFLTSAVKDILTIKQLYLEGDIYDDIRGIPECFDEKKLHRYSSYLKTITESLTYSNIARLYIKLRESGKWYTVKDMLDFIYNYYMEVVYESIS